MKKIISTALSTFTVMSMLSVVAVPVVSAADTTKATIHVVDFMGDAYDRNQTTQTQFIDKSVDRGTYQFDVGDLVNVTVAYQSSNPAAISGFMGYTFINQSTADPSSANAFKNSTSASVMELTDKYYTQNSANPAGTYILNQSAGMLMSYPETISSATDAAMDKVAYTASIGAKTGMSISTETKMLTFTVEIKEAAESYLYSVLEDAVDTTDAFNSVTENLSVKTTLTKVGSTNTSVASVSKAVTVNKGDVVVYNFKAKSTYEINSFALTTTYNSSEFSLYTAYSKDGVNTIAAAQGGTESVNTQTAGKITTSVTAKSGSPYNIATQTNLQTVKFVAKKSGTFTISATLDSILDKNNKAVSYGGTKLTVTNTTSITVVEDDKIGAVSKSIYVKKGDVIVYTVKARSKTKFQSYELVTKYNKDAFSLYTKYSSDGVTTMKLNQGGTESVRTKTLGTITATVTADASSLYYAPELSNLEIVKLVALKDGTFTISTTIKSMKTSSGAEMATTSVKFTNTGSVTTPATTQA